MRIFAYAATSIVLCASSALAAGPTGYCPAKLDATAQDEIFERVINVGASFTHGCVSCDYLDGFSTYHRLTHDGPWIRRNPLLTFLIGTPWKNERLGANDFVAIFENDSDTDVGETVRAEKKNYQGFWGYYPQLDTAAMLSPATIDKLNGSAAFQQNVKLVGGPQILKIKDRTQTGIVFQWVQKQTDGQLNVKPFSLLDLSTDGGRMHEFIRSTSSAANYKKLYSKGWRDAALRKIVVDESVARIASMNPSSVIVFDALFWDAIVESFAYLYEKKPSSLVLKILKPFIGWQSFGADMGDPVKRDNIRADFFEILKRTSLLTSTHGRPVPVFLARLLDDPLTVFQEPKMEMALASLFGQVLYRLTGEDYSAALFEGLAAARPTEKTNGFTFTFPFFNGKPSFADDALGGVAAGRIGFPLRPVLNLSIGGALKDLPLFMEGFHFAFNKINRSVDVLKTQTDDHHIQVINASVFYKNFPSLLNPESSHPSIVGSRIIANTLEWELCQ